MNIFQSSDALNIKLRLPTDAEQSSHDKMEGVLLVTTNSISSIRLPDRLLKNAPCKIMHCASYGGTFISSGK